MATPLLELDSVSISLPRSDGGAIIIVNDVSFALGKGETLGIVGESGSGKSLLALAIMGLLPPAATIGGRILLEGENLIGKPESEMCEVRGGRFGMIFQEPMTALNPAMTIGDQIAEGMVRHRAMGRAAAREEAVHLLDRVQISHPRERAKTFPHEMSGGQRQRVGIAIALALEPDLIIADEPTTALDVTVQAEILDMLDDLTRATGMAMIIVSHDLGVIARAAARTLVMYAGTRMESGATAEVLHRPLHPYTGGLLSAMPRRRITPEARLTTITGTVPRFDRLPMGCRFGPRCPLHMAACDDREPQWRDFGAHGVRCIRAEEPS